MTDYGRSPEFKHKDFNIHVWDEYGVMPTYYLEHMGNDDEYALTKAWLDLHDWMIHKHSYDNKTQQCDVYNILTTLDHKGVHGVDYIIRGATSKSDSSLWLWDESRERCGCGNMYVTGYEGLCRKCTFKQGRE